MTGRRRDPRAELAAQASRGVHGLRIDRAQKAPLQGVAIDLPQPGPDRILRVDSPACLVAAIADAPEGRLSPHDRQVLGAASVLAQGGGAVVLVAPVPMEESGAAGADRLIMLAPAHDPAVQASHIAGLIENLDPLHVVFAESAQGGDLARRVAALRGEALFADAERVTVREATRPGRAGRSEFRSAPPRLIAIAADCVAPYAGPPREARAIDVPFAASMAPGFLDIEDLPQEPGRMALAEADFVAAAGNGVTDFAMFQTLAASLGATPGASRVVCDAGKMPRDRQVGASGTVLGGRCYLAFGIAGAPQHLQGVAGVEHVIAVNTDLHASMIKRATLAIVADAQAVMPALLARLQRTARE